ncbi:AI-2E family transporter [Persicimonas caeni]|uniref:AI-2E family transporter n=2 Tax=Persicimonas caeni TaxID=2292766 RepID=A0A4Y6Q092_PERCE|nr:AI-2E family transporter [Persicimonas caeni]QED35080.1 AI-2E family transporter [Persicimonas caeni]
MTNEPMSEHDVDAKEHPESALFQRLSAEQYKTRLLRYTYILMRVLFAVIIGYAILWLAEALGTLLFPLLASLVLAYLLHPWIDTIEARGLSRRLSIVVVLAAAFLTLGIVAVFLLPPLIRQLGDVIADIPKLITTIQEEWIPWLERRLRTELPTTVREGLESAGQRAGTSLPEVAQRAGSWTVGAVFKTGQVLFAAFNLLLIPLFSYYFLRKFDQASHAIAGWLPVRRREYTLGLLSRMDSAVGSWFRGQVQVASLMGVLYGVGLVVAFAIADIDPKLGIAIGIIVAVLNIIPYFGMIVASLITTLVVLLNWPGWGGVLAVVIVFLINQFLEGYVVGPKILGDSVDLNPIAVIILLLAGAELAGIWGMLLIVPLAGAIRIVWPDLMAIYRETAFYRGDLDEAEG